MINDGGSRPGGQVDSGSYYSPKVYSCYVADDTWDESTLTWNTAPVYSDALGYRGMASAIGYRRTYFTYDAAMMNDVWNESADLLDNNLSIAMLPELDAYTKILIQGLLTQEKPLFDGNQSEQRSFPLTKGR